MDPAERPRLHHSPLLEAPPVAAPLRLLLHSAPPCAAVLVYMHPRLTSVVSICSVRIHREVAVGWMERKIGME